MLRLFALLQRMVKPTPFLSQFFPSPEISLLWDFNRHHSLWDSKGTFDPCGEEVFGWVISSDLLPLNNPDIPTLLHCSSGSGSSTAIFFAPSSPTFSCSWEVLQDLSFDYLPILQIVPLSPVFRPNERSPSFNFWKVCWEYFLPLSSAAALFTSLTLNASKLFILLTASNAILNPGGPLKWKMRLVKDVRLSLPLTEVIKIVKPTSPLPDALRLSSPRTMLRHGRRLALLFHPNLTLNFCSPSFALSLAHLPPLLASPTVPLSGNQFRFAPIT